MVSIKHCPMQLGLGGGCFKRPSPGQRPVGAQAAKLRKLLKPYIIQYGEEAKNSLTESIFGVYVRNKLLRKIH